MAQQHFTRGDARSAASKFGQMIGEAFEKVALAFVKSYVEMHHMDYKFLEPEQGRKLILLQTFRGTSRQLDSVIVDRESDSPIALLEAKWLKDARHHNDKGAWILQLDEVLKANPTVRGAAAILAGFWTEGVGVFLQSEAGVKMVLVATDEEVYGTLQEPLNHFLADDTFQLDAAAMRKSYPRPWDLANLLLALSASGDLSLIAESWLTFPRKIEADGRVILGKDLIAAALDDLLAPLPVEPTIKRYEIALRIETGNVIYKEFDDIEEVIEFLREHYDNPAAILKQISPRKKQ